VIVSAGGLDGSYPRYDTPAPHARSFPFSSTPGINPIQNKGLRAASEAARSDGGQGILGTSRIRQWLKN
jgi:hypothetical protein